MTDRPTDRTRKRVNSRPLTLLLFRILQNSLKNVHYCDRKCHPRWSWNTVIARVILSTRDGHLGHVPLTGTSPNYTVAAALWLLLNYGNFIVAGEKAQPVIFFQKNLK